MKLADDLTILVTGSTDGIGKQAAIGLARMGAMVLVHGRDPRRGRMTVDEIGASTGSEKLEYYNADLSSLDEVRRLAAEVSRAHDDLDVLVNNAGIGIGPKGERRREVSVDGFELRLAVNYLAPFLLSHLLVPALRRSAPSRIVNVSSLGQSPLDLEDLMLERSYDAWDAYGQSKLALVMFTFDLAEELESYGITVNAVSPGSLLDTKIVREWMDHGRGDVQQGADAEIFMATAPELAGISGRFFDQKMEARAHRQAYDSRVRENLRRTSYGLTGLGRLPFREQIIHETIVE